MKTLFTIIIAIIFFILIMNIVLMDLHDIFRNDTVSQKTKDKVSVMHLYTVISLALFAYRILIPNNTTTFSEEEMEEINFVLFEIEEQQNDLEDSVVSLYTILDDECDNIDEAMLVLDCYFYDTGCSKNDAREAFDELKSLKKEYYSACNSYQFLSDYENFIRKKQYEINNLLNK